jgi:hypothetical protein
VYVPKCICLLPTLCSPLFAGVLLQFAFACTSGLIGKTSCAVQFRARTDRFGRDAQARE